MSSRRLTPALATAMLVAMLAALLVPLQAAAQEIGEGPADDTATEGDDTQTGGGDRTGEVGEQPRDPADEDPTADAFEVTGLRLPVPEDVFEDGSRGLLMWPEGRRVYQFIQSGTPNAKGLAAFDLDTMEEVERGLFLPQGRDPYGDQWSRAAPGTMPVDPTGRLFIPYTDKDLAIDDEGCGGEPSSHNCLSGILVVDATTLEVRADHPFEPIAIDGVAVRPALRAMSYHEPEGGTGKLLLLVEAQGVGGSVASQGDGILTRAGAAYAMQLDPDDGSVDWTTRLPACNANSTPNAQAVTAIRNVIFGTELEADRPEIYVGCFTGAGGTAAIVRLNMDPDDPDAAPASQLAFRGPAGINNMLADPASARILLFMVGQGESLVVFDGARGGFTAALGLGASSVSAVKLGLDAVDGRLYALSSRRSTDDGFESRFLAGTTRGPTLPQLTAVPSLAGLVADHLGGSFEHLFPMAVDPATADRPARILVRPGQGDAPDFYYIVEDHRAASEIVGGDVIRDLPYTDDVPQVEGATEVAFTGAARGYGLRTLLVGGLMSVVSQSNARGHLNTQAFGKTFDVSTLISNAWNNPVVRNLLERHVDNYPDNPAEGLVAEEVGAPGAACLYRDRELVFGVAGALDVLPDLGPTGSAGQASGATVDFQTAEDLTAPGRCAEGLVALISDTLSGSGVREPEPVDMEELSPAFAEASCVAPGKEPADEVDEEGSQTSPASTSYAAVSCDEGRQTAGTGRTRFVDVGPVSVGEASSTFDITHAPGGGLVATVRSIARDVNIGGVVHIDSVESTAISWATGRSQPEETLEGDFNCVQGRTAGTCLERTLRGVTAGDLYSCDQCAFSNEQMLDGMRQALGDGWLVDMPEPDEFLARGASNGALAGVIKRPERMFADTIMNSDTLPTLPALQLTRVNDDKTGRGRQIYQFAGVEMSASFGILCLLEVIDGECTQRPGALSIELLDLESLPLPGGVFELYRDVEEATDGDEAEADAGASPSETESPSESESPSETPSPTESESESDADPSPSESETEAAATMSGASVPLGAPADDPSSSESETEADADPSESETASEDPSEDPTGEPTGDATEDTTEDVLSDVAADGSLVDPLVDELVGDGSCTTGADGIGDCRFENLTPGTYIVRQVSAPDGMLGAADFELTIGSGEDLTATVTNVSAIGRVDISLTDGEGAPLAGGEFSLAPAGDAAADETVVDDALSTLSTDGSAPSGSCTTDAEGACSITVSLPDGPTELMLSQTVAPEGLAPAPPTPLTLSPGETFTFSFTNVAPAGGTITIALVDDLTDAPLGGGRFEVHADEGDGLLGDGDTLVASCATGADGACLYEAAAVDAAALGREGPLAASGTELMVPLGAYVVHQAATLEGYEPADDIAFAFDAPGQFAAITVRNGGGTVPSESDFGSAPAFSPAPSAAGPFTMDLDVPPPHVAPTQTADLGPSMQQILQLPADLARLVVRDPLQGLAFIATWLMFAGAAVTVHRRLMLADTLAA